MIRYIAAAVVLLISLGLFFLLSNGNDAEATGEEGQTSQTQAQANNASNMERYGDWFYGCGENNAEGNKCLISQEIFVNQENGQGGRLLTLQILKNTTPENKEERPYQFNVLVPLGVFLPTGVTLRVDEEEPTTVVLQRCTQAGCVGFFFPEEGKIENMKKGSELVVSFRLPNGQNLQTKASLKGFTKAVQAL